MGKPPDSKCKISFCPGKENCAVLSLIDDAPNLDDLNNTMKTIAPDCDLANDPNLVRIFIEKKTLLIYDKDF